MSSQFVISALGLYGRLAVLLSLDMWERERGRDGIDLSCFSNSKSIVSQSKTKAHCPGPADCCYASIGFYEKKGGEVVNRMPTVRFLLT